MTGNESDNFDAVGSDADAAWRFLEAVRRGQRTRGIKPWEISSREWRREVSAASHDAFGRTHLAVGAPDGEATYPIMWSLRGQFPSGPILRFGDVVVTPSPSGSPAIHPHPRDARPATFLDETVHAIIFIGQSLSIWSNGGGPQGQAWTAQLEWEGRPADPRLMMFNGGILNPGVVKGAIQAPEAQSMLVMAFDQLHGPVPEYDDVGNETGRIAHRNSTSAAIAHMMRRALGADGHRFGTRWASVSIGVGAKPIDHFLPKALGGKSGWYERVFVPTLANLIAAAEDRPLVVSEIPMEHGEADSQSSTREAYRERLDVLTGAMRETILKATGASYSPVFAQTQIGNVLLSLGAATTGRPPLEASDVAFAILDKGLSRAEGDADFLCVGPRYDLTFIGVSHLDHFGYLHNDERRAFALNEHERLRRLDPSAKWLPAHVISASVAIEPGNGKDPRHVVRLACHAPFPPLRLDVDLIPKKRDFGFTLKGGNEVPDIVGCRIGDDGVSIVLELSGAWTGEGRVVGIATKAVRARQGWYPSDGTPQGIWNHVGLGCNVHDSAPWSSMATGHLLPNWMCSQYVAVADEPR